MSPFLKICVRVLLHVNFKNRGRGLTEGELGRVMVDVGRTNLGQEFADFLESEGARMLDAAGGWHEDIGLTEVLSASAGRDEAVESGGLVLMF